MLLNYIKYNKKRKIEFRNLIYFYFRIKFTAVSFLEILINNIFISRKQILSLDIEGHISGASNVV